MAKGKKHLPKFLDNSSVKNILQNNFVIILTYLVFQSMLHTNKKETVFKLSITVFLSIFFILFMHPVSAIILAHMINALFNGHIPAMLIHMGYGSKQPKDFISYIEVIDHRINKNQNIWHAFAYGSLSRGIYRPTSDLDIRVVPKKNKWVNSLFFLIRERTQALIHWFPLDIYAFDESELKIKMRTDEKPICFKSGFEIYDDVIKFRDFVEIFKIKNLSWWQKNEI